MDTQTIQKIQHIPCEYLMSAIWAFDHIENKHTLYHGNDCMKNLYEYLTHFQLMFHLRKNQLDDYYQQSI